MGRYCCPNFRMFSIKRLVLFTRGICVFFSGSYLAPKYKLVALKYWFKSIKSWWFGYCLHSLNLLSNNWTKKFPSVIYLSFHHLHACWPIYTRDVEGSWCACNLLGPLKNKHITTKAYVIWERKLENCILSTHNIIKINIFKCITCLQHYCHTFYYMFFKHSKHMLIM